MKPGELTVVTKAKDLCHYIMTVTDKSPKKFRFTLTSRMQNLSLDIIENTYRANDVYMAGTNITDSAKERLGFQHKALTSAKLLGYLTMLAREEGCILPKQYELITKQVHDVQNLLGAWINSDRRRLQQ